MTDEHPSHSEYAALATSGLPPGRGAAVLRHLFTGCQSCRAAVPTPLAVILGIESARAQPSPTEDAAYDAVIDRTFRVARRHAQHLAQQKAQAGTAVTALESGGLEAAEKVARSFKGLAFFEALLARSWELRHQDPGQMIQYAWLATLAVEGLTARRYGQERIFDFRSRAWAELANAHRVADKLELAEQAFAKAFALYSQGTGDRFIGMRLLELYASLAADQRRFGLARKSLSLVYKFYRRHADPHLAGRVLISQGLYTGYAGEVDEAINLLQQGISLINEDREPSLASAAAHNQLLFLFESGRFREARRFRFLNRNRLERNSGLLNRLRLDWLDARVNASLGEHRRAEEVLRKVKRGFEEWGRSYDAALASLDLGAVLLSMGQAAEPQTLIVEAVRVFAALGIDREAMGAVLLLRQAFEVRTANVVLVEEVATFLRRIENDPSARFDPH